MITCQAMTVLVIKSKWKLVIVFFYEIIINLLCYTIYNLQHGNSIINIVIIQVEESEPVKKDRKIENRTRYKGPESKRTYRSDRTDGKDVKDRTLDPMDPASYSDIPRYVFLFTNVWRLTYVYFT